MNTKQKKLGIFLFALAVITSLLLSAGKDQVEYDEYDRLMW